MENIRKNYSLEFKIQSVSLSEQRGNVSSVAEELGICKESIINWRKLHKEGKHCRRSKFKGNYRSNEFLCRWCFSIRILRKSNGFTTGTECKRYTATCTRNDGLCNRNWPNSQKTSCLF